MSRKDDGKGSRFWAGFGLAIICMIVGVVVATAGARVMVDSLLLDNLSLYNTGWLLLTLGQVLIGVGGLSLFAIFILMIQKALRESKSQMKPRTKAEKRFWGEQNCIICGALGTHKRGNQWFCIDHTRKLETDNENRC